VVSHQVDRDLLQDLAGPDGVLIVGVGRVEALAADLGVGHEVATGRQPIQASADQGDTVAPGGQALGEPVDHGGVPERTGRHSAGGGTTRVSRMGGRLRAWEPPKDSLPTTRRGTRRPVDWGRTSTAPTPAVIVRHSGQRCQVMTKEDEE
jgi:hypothetical protein